MPLPGLRRWCSPAAELDWLAREQRRLGTVLEMAYAERGYQTYAALFRRAYQHLQCQETALRTALGHTDYCGEDLARLHTWPTFAIPAEPHNDRP